MRPSGFASLFRAFNLAFVAPVMIAATISTSHLPARIGAIGDALQKFVYLKSKSPDYPGLTFTPLGHAPATSWGTPPGRAAAGGDW